MAFRGANWIQHKSAPFPSADKSLTQLSDLGGNTVAVVPFMWQPAPNSVDLVKGDAVSDEQLRHALREARSRGLHVLLKPHVWIPEHWAGEINFSTREEWSRWFNAYRRNLVSYARIAEQEHVEFFSIGVELVQSLGNSELWKSTIADVRAVFSGKLIYVAHQESLESVDFWPLLDVVGVSVYPSLPNPRIAYEDVVNQVSRHITEIQAFGEQHRMPVWIAELGIRSVEYAHEKPWSSIEQTSGEVDHVEQLLLYEAWLSALRESSINGLLLWYWSTRAYGSSDSTDFTIQQKPVYGLIYCYWRDGCSDKR